MFLSHYWKSSAGGVASVFASVSVVGEASAIAVRNVGMPAGEKPIEKPKEDIDGRKEVGRPIERRRNAVGWD